MHDGSIKDVHSLKVLIFRGGLDPSIRKEVWKYLLGVYDWKNSSAENEAVMKKSLTFSLLKQFLFVFLFSSFNLRKCAIHGFLISNFFL